MFLSRVPREVRAPTFHGSVSVALTLRSIALAVLVVVAQILGRTPATIPILSMESWMWQSWQPGCGT